MQVTLSLFMSETGNVAWNPSRTCCGGDVLMSARAGSVNAKTVSAEAPRAPGRNACLAISLLLSDPTEDRRWAERAGARPVTSPDRGAVPAPAGRLPLSQHDGLNGRGSGRPALARAHPGRGTPVRPHRMISGNRRKILWYFPGFRSGHARNFSCRMTFRRRGYLCLCRRCAVKDFLRRMGIRFGTLFESPSGLTRRPDPGYLRGGEKRETTLIQSGGGPGPAKPQQPAREGAVLIPTR